MASALYLLYFDKNTEIIAEKVRRSGCHCHSGPLVAITAHYNNHQAVWISGYVFQVLMIPLEVLQLSLVSFFLSPSVNREMESMLLLSIAIM